MTVLQSATLVFTGGLETTFDGQTSSTPEKADDSFDFSRLLQPGETFALSFAFGDPVGADGSQGPVGPEFDALVNATPAPLSPPVGLLAGGLGVMGWLGRRNRATTR